MFIKQRNNLLWFKYNGLTRYILVHFFSSCFPLYIVNEYPKSGGSWLAQMLSKALSVPFPRNRLPMLKSCIMQGHYLSSWNMKNVVVLWRDGRDVLISQYYHSLFKNERGNERGVDITRKNLKFKDYSDIQKNLPEFMRYVYEEKKHPKFSWSDFVNKWADNTNVIYVKYEDLRRNTDKEIQRIVYALTGKDIALDDANLLKKRERSLTTMPGRNSLPLAMNRIIPGRIHRAGITKHRNSQHGTIYQSR
jgi:hypothetical protein